MMWILLALAPGFILVEKLWPAMDLPRVRAWWPRVILVNLLHLGCTLLAGHLWTHFLGGVSFFALSEHLNDFAAGTVCYLVATVAYYWWHRIRHDSQLFWRLCHQFHHSPRRVEVAMAFYKHPVEIVCNSVLSSAIAYLLLGCSPGAVAFYALLAGTAEFFYHWNIRTPRWLGYVIQRPESHRVHHRRAHHTDNYGDLPVLDLLFGTFDNPRTFEGECGFEPDREDRIEDMLAFRDVNRAAEESKVPLHFLPTCIGCGKRWACREARLSVKSGHAQAEGSKKEGDTCA